jgi:large subunit ribosomal protein L13
MTGNKWSEKKYYRHSRFFGSLKEFTATEMKTLHPEHIIQDAVKGMLPKNKLNTHVLDKLKIYTGAEHPHSAQKPSAWTGK